MEEIWKDVATFEGLYQVSDQGNVRRILRDGNTRLVKGRKRGIYLQVDLSDQKNGRLLTAYVHRLVAQHFIPNPRMVECVNHKDGNRLNNKAENLEWLTDRENLEHGMYVLGHAPFGKKPKAVEQYTLDGRFVTTYNSIGEACRELNDPNARAPISNCCNNLRKTARGYIWKFAER